MSRLLVLPVLVMLTGLGGRRWAVAGAVSGGRTLLSCPSAALSAATERYLHTTVTAWEGRQPAFHRRRALADRFMDSTLHELRGLSTLLANASLLRLGSAYEGTHISQAVDFDAFFEVDETLLSAFEMERHADGWVAARLRRGVGLTGVPSEMRQLLTGDGRHLDARRFKRWTFDLLVTAAHRAAARLPGERLVSVTERAQVVGVTLRRGGGGGGREGGGGGGWDVVNVDLSAMLRAPTGWRALRADALRPCGLQLTPPGRPGRSHLYSQQRLARPEDPSATDGHTARLFTPDSLCLEQQLLLRVPAVRRRTRLLKILSAARRWSYRFGLQPIVLKRAVFTDWADRCDQQDQQEQTTDSSGLMDATISSLGIVQRALQRGTFTCCWTDVPVNRLKADLSSDPDKMATLAGEIAEVVDVISKADVNEISELFQSTCPNGAFWKPKVAFD